MSKRILITGGAGFLGSHLIEKLISKKSHIICVDNLYTGSLKNIEVFKKNKNFEFVNHDIEKKLDIEVDEIYNLACPASPIHYQADPIKTTKTSVIGSINMLELANKNKSKIFHASTSEVYGDPNVHPQVESYWGNVNPIGIRSCYDEGKRCAETLFFDYNRKFGTEIRIARIFNTYGPKMQLNDGRVVSNFIVQALKGEDITIYGDGSQTRSFCYVDDLIDGFIRFMNVIKKNDGVSLKGPLNLGNPVEFSILELAEMVIAMIGGKSKIIFLPLPSDDPTQRKPDITEAKKILNGWSPKVILEDGLSKTIDYFREVV